MENFLLISLCIVFVTLGSHCILGDCPTPCACDTDSKGRKRVRCDRGDLAVPSSFNPQQIDKATQVLVISAPFGKPNTVSLLSPDMFRGLTLEELHITNSQLQAIGDRTFFHLSSTLRVLNLAGNNLVDIHENNFRNLSGLTHLHLDNNQIVNIYSATFNYQNTLKVLTLSNNRIYNLGTRLLLQQNSLEVIDLSGNSIGLDKLEGTHGGIPELMFQDVPNLRRISLANTSIDRLPYSAIASNCLHLEDVDVSHNKFTTVPAGQFSKLKSLRKLSFRGNQLTGISPGAFKGMKLDFLDLSSTNLPLQASFFDGVDVKHLSIASNGLQSIDPQTLLPIAQDLTALDVGGNPLTLKERMFSFAPNLKGISLSNMRLTRLPRNLFDYPHHITTFNISFNAFQELDEETLTALPKLEILDMSHNEVQRVPWQLVKQAQLAELYVNNNLLKKIPDSTVDVFRGPSSKLTVLRVEGNPLECDWSIGAINSWISTPQGRKVVCGPDKGYKCPLCHSPASLKGKPIDEVKVSVA